MKECWKYFLILALFFSLLVARAGACPPISNLIDFNCNRKLKLVFVGDSFAFGRGDTRNGDVGGYVRRIKKHYGNVKAINFGHPGFTAFQLYQKLKAGFTKKESFIRQLKGADFIMVDIGRNAYFKDTPPATVVRNIKRLVSLLRKKLKTKAAGSPYIVVATQAPNNRSFQFSYVDEINDNLLARSSSKFPVLVRFDLLPKSIIDSGGLHPSSKGYKVMTNLLIDDLENTIASRQLALRPDIDGDSVYDRFESSLFGTDSSLFDTDGDGFSDGEEIFELETDPLVANDELMELLF